MTDLTQRAKDRIAVVRQWRGNDDTDAAIMEELLSEVERLRAALTDLVDLNDNYSPFGGEIYQDRIEQTWNLARAALQRKEGGE